MSHATGAVKFPDGTIMHCEYSGTVDVMIPILYDTYDEMMENWRSNKWKECYFHSTEIVKIATTYGRGFCWSGTACRICKVLTSQLSPDYESIKNELPEWYPNRKAHVK